MTLCTIKKLLLCSLLIFNTASADIIFGPSKIYKINTEKYEEAINSIADLLDNYNYDYNYFKDFDNEFLCSDECMKNYHCLLTFFLRLKACKKIDLCNLLKEEFDNLIDTEKTYKSIIKYFNNSSYNSSLNNKIDLLRNFLQEKIDYFSNLYNSDSLNNLEYYLLRLSCSSAKTRIEEYLIISEDKIIPIIDYIIGLEKNYPFSMNDNQNKLQSAKMDIKIRQEIFNICKGSGFVETNTYKVNSKIIFY